MTGCCCCTHTTLYCANSSDRLHNSTTAIDSTCCSLVTAAPLTVVQPGEEGVVHSRGGEDVNEGDKFDEANTADDSAEDGE